MVAPDAVRMLLTGHADVEAAIRAVNEAQLFRFLTKPCDVGELLRACAGALGQHRLHDRRARAARADRCAAASTRSRRRSPSPTRRRSAAAAASRRSPSSSPQPAKLDELRGRSRSRPCSRTSARSRSRRPPPRSCTRASALTAGGGRDGRRESPQITRRLLGKIPRLEGVLEILDTYRTTPAPGDWAAIDQIPVGARVLRIAVDYDELESGGASRHRRARHACAAVPSTIAGCWHVRRRSSASAAALPRCARSPSGTWPVGMTLADDVRNAGGGLLVARGQRVTDQLIERLAELQPPARSRSRCSVRSSSSDEPIGPRVLVRRRRRGRDSARSGSCSSTTSRSLLDGLRDALRSVPPALDDELRHQRRGRAGGARARAIRRRRSRTCGCRGWTARACSSVRDRAAVRRPDRPLGPRGAMRSWRAPRASPTRLLAKPCETEDLARVIERSCAIQEISARVELDRRAMGASVLPSVPASLPPAHRARSRSGEPRVADVSGIVEQDMAMAAKVLQLANSAYFGRRHPVTGIADAVVYLGLEAAAGARAPGRCIPAEFTSTRRSRASTSTSFSATAAGSAISPERCWTMMRPGR